MRGFQPVETLLRAAAFLARRRDRNDALPRLGRAREILLAERADDALVEQRLEMRRIELERVVELRERPVGLLRVVVGHGEIGADVDVSSGRA